MYTLLVLGLVAAFCLADDDFTNEYDYTDEYSAHGVGGGYPREGLIRHRASLGEGIMRPLLRAVIDGFEVIDRLLEGGTGKSPEEDKEGNGPGTPKEGNKGASKEGNGGISENGNGGTPKKGNKGTSKDGNVPGIPGYGNGGTPKEGNKGTSKEGNREIPEKCNEGTPKEGNKGTSKEGNGRGIPEIGNGGTPKEGNKGTSKTGVSKPGRCPLKKIYQELELGPHCKHDEQCPEVQKCCYAGDKGRRCQVPAELEHQGSCNEHYIIIGGMHVPCSDDAICPYGGKCCKRFSTGQVDACTYPSRKGPLPRIQRGPDRTGAVNPSLVTKIKEVIRIPGGPGRTNPSLVEELTVAIRN